MFCNCETSGCLELFCFFVFLVGLNYFGFVGVFWVCSSCLFRLRLPVFEFFYGFVPSLLSYLDRFFHKISGFVLSSLFLC